MDYHRIVAWVKHRWLENEKLSHQGILSRRVLRFKTTIEEAVWLMLWCPRGIPAQQPCLLLSNLSIVSLKVILRPWWCQSSCKCKFDSVLPEPCTVVWQKVTARAPLNPWCLYAWSLQVRLQIFYCDLFCIENKTDSKCMPGAELVLQTAKMACSLGRKSLSKFSAE